jgi:hypothetical protein
MFVCYHHGVRQYSLDWWRTAMSGGAILTQERLRKIAKSLQLVRNRRKSVDRRHVVEMRVNGRKVRPILVERG